MATRACYALCADWHHHLIGFGVCLGLALLGLCLCATDDVVCDDGRHVMKICDSLT